MKHCLALCFIFFLCACSVKNQNFSSQSLMVLIASPMIKINDAAFLKKENNALNLEVYKLGQAFFKLKIREDICLNSVCYSKMVFNQKFFKNAYYEDILKDILEAKPLWNGKNMQKTQCGFNQNLNSANYEIFYEVCDNKISFVDRISRIKIVLMNFKDKI
ncbi:hypothetical protein F0F11_04560 [Campylobacter coli]|nr:hypothetical protein [Campylobacter coli]